MSTNTSGTSATLSTLEDAYGGRSHLVDMLGTLTDPRAIKVTALLSDPQWCGKTLSEVCRAADVTPATVLMLLRDGAVTRAVATAHLRLQQRLPAVIERVADAAEGGLDVCRCTVGGQKQALDDCPQCRGTGHSVRQPSLPHQELVLDILGVTPKPGPAVSVTTNVQQNVMAVGSIFDTFVKQGRPAPVVVSPVPPTAVLD